MYVEKVYIVKGIGIIFFNLQVDLQVTEKDVFFLYHTR